MICSWSGETCSGGVVKSVAGVVRIATKTLEFVFLQVDEKQANQTSYQ